MAPSHNALALFAVVLTLVGFIPYILSILRGEIRPALRSKFFCDFGYIDFGYTILGNV